MFIYLISFDLGFAGLEPNLKEILIMDFVYDPSFHKDTFLRRLRRVVNATLLIQTVLAKAAKHISVLPKEEVN
jgi:hypothetical protein